MNVGIGDKPRDKLKPRNCCVPGCENRDAKRHRFPKKSPDIFKAWVERIKPRRYEVLSVDEVYKLCVVCDIHFLSSDIVPGRRGLKLTAIPCLNIPSFSGDSVEVPQTEGAMPQPFIIKVEEENLLDEPFPIKHLKTTDGGVHIDEEFCDNTSETSREGLVSSVTNDSIASRRDDDDDDVIMTDLSSVTRPSTVATNIYISKTITV